MDNRRVFKPSIVKRVTAWRTEVEQWFLIRLPIVVDDASAAFPKPRYYDAPARERDPTSKP
jgi:hypothetical protein